MTIRIFIFILLISFCSPTPKGRFGWYIQEVQEGDQLSEKSFITKHYTITNEKMIFKKDFIISYLYEFDSLPSKKEITVSLNKFSLDYAEISFSKKKINANNQIWGLYKDLTVGKYQIQLSENLEIFDSVEFEIVE